MAYLGIDPKVAYSSYRNIDDISASFDGFVTTFPLTVNGVAPTILPINEQQLLINIGGVPQQPDPSGANGFRLVAGNIVFSSAPSIGETFWGVILATANYISANTRFTDGSASLPSVTFASDPTTGIYYLGAGQLALSTGGTERAVVNSSGVTIHGQGDLRLADSDNSNWVALQAPATVSSNVTWTLPATDGATGQAITTDGSGTLAWSAAVAPPGSIIWHAASTAPTGYVKANGANLSRSTYAALFAVIGTVYGVGDGSTTFTLPDLRGEFIRGWADGRAVDTGRTFASFQDQAYLSHAHGVADPTHAHAVYDPGHVHSLNYQTPLNQADNDRGGGSSDFSIDNPVVPGTQAAATDIGIYGAATGVSIQNSGGAETRPRNIALLACIKF